MLFIFFSFLFFLQEGDTAQLNQESRLLSKDISYKFALLEAIESGDKHLFAPEIHATDRQIEKVEQFLKTNPYFAFRSDLREKPLEMQVEMYRAKNQQLDRFLEEVFLEHQLERMNQIMRQVTRPRNDGFSLVLEFADELRLTPEEIAKVKAKTEEQRNVFSAEDARLREKARRAILHTLQPELRKVVERELGSPFDFDAYYGEIRAGN
jgi:hypothetical protein